MPDRPYDVVLLGATGFTGGLVARRLASRVHDLSRVAFAGRNRAKLERLQAELSTEHPDAMKTGLLHADVTSPRTLLVAAEQARVLATTAGPFDRLGEPVVAACIDAGTDYVDITGEPQFVNRLLLRYDHPAREAGVRIVNCCGFDSIPHDLGAQFTAEQMPDDLPMTIRAYVAANARFSGGTFRSALESMAASPKDVLGAGPRPGDPDRRVRGIRPAVQRIPVVGGYGIPLPTIDPQVVLRSAKMLPEFGPDFTYGHFARLPHAALVPVAGIGLGGALLAARIPPLRRLVEKFGPDPGEGPDEETRARSWFRVTFLAEAGDVRLHTEVRGGDMGYDETSKMVAESVLCLLHDDLPERHGVLTPAVAMGSRLRARLIDQGIAFETVGPW